MTRDEIEAKVGKMLRRMGCASVAQLAASGALSEGTLRERERLVRGALKRIGAQARGIGGFKCYHDFYMPNNAPKGKGWNLPRIEMWRIGGWKQAHS